MDRVQLKNTALHLRRSGLSYGEILKQVNVPKSTLAYWLRGMSLEEDQESSLQSRVFEKQKRGRFTTSIALRARRVFREKESFEEARKLFDLYVGGVSEVELVNQNQLLSSNFFIAGISLYWAQGGKKSGYFQFISSDQDAILLVTSWIEKFLAIPKDNLKYRLFIDGDYKTRNIEGIWANTLGVKPALFQETQYLWQKTSISRKRNSSYKGSLCVTITNIAILRRVIAWQNLLIKYYRGVGVNL